jgi:6-phosphogluconate dehydrogenase
VEAARRLDKLLASGWNKGNVMQIGMVGLGRMGLNMATRLIKGGHSIVGFDPIPYAVEGLVEAGGRGAGSLEELVNLLRTAPGGEPASGPHAVWVMVPAGQITETTISTLAKLLDDGDTIIDGGNSYYKDTLRRGEELKAEGIHFVDCGTSGGIWGLAEGYSMMVGGEEGAVEALRPIFETLAPGADKGWGRVGPPASGHYVKMVHNGIEYGLMQAYAEGLAVLKKKAEFNLDLAQVSEIWRFGSVVRSWLLDLTAQALHENPQMDGIAPFVADSGEGRWTVFEAIDLDVPAWTMTASLFERFRSRDNDAFYDKLLAAMRAKFGGHAIKKED